jgi:hypothetical protein
MQELRRRIESSHAFTSSKSLSHPYIKWQILFVTIRRYADLRHTMHGLEMELQKEISP